MKTIIVPARVYRILQDKLPPMKTDPEVPGGFAVRLTDEAYGRLNWAAQQRGVTINEVLETQYRDATVIELFQIYRRLQRRSRQRRRER